MNKVKDINSLLKRLIILTNENMCQWDELSNNAYRIVLKSGTIQIQKQIDSFATTFYTIKLFDNAECFATYSSISDYTLNQLSEDLFEDIIKYRERAVNIKIADVFGDL